MRDCKKSRTDHAHPYVYLSWNLVKISPVHSKITGLQEVKGKGFPYSLPSVGSGDDPGVQTVSPQVTISHPPDGRLPVLSARPEVTFPATEHHCPLASTKLYCLVTEAHRCEQLAQGCYTAFAREGYEPTTCRSQVQRSTHCATTPPESYCTCMWIHLWMHATSHWQCFENRCYLPSHKAPLPFG